MHIAPHANLTITLLRRNAYGNLRFRGAGTPSRQISLAQRLRITPPTLKPCAWYWQDTNTLGHLIDVVA